MALALHKLQICYDHVIHPIGTSDGVQQALVLRGTPLPLLWLLQVSLMMGIVTPMTPPPLLMLIFVGADPLVKHRPSTVKSRNALLLYYRSLVILTLFFCNMHQTVMLPGPSWFNHLPLSAETKIRSISFDAFLLISFFECVVRTFVSQCARLYI